MYESGLVTITEVTDNFPFAGKLCAPEIEIASVKIFCGFPGESNTYGVGTKKAIKTIIKNRDLLKNGRFALTGES